MGYDTAESIALVRESRVENRALLNAGMTFPFSPANVGGTKPQNLLTLGDRTCPLNPPILGDFNPLPPNFGRLGGRKGLNCVSPDYKQSILCFSNAEK
jgi:hypothetical protein